MPWYWTDDLARILIDTGKVSEQRVSSWLTAPMAIRSDDSDSETVADSLLDGEEGEPPTAALAA